MSVYKNFIQDFPDRCDKILKEYRSHAEKSGLEATLMLAIASVAIPIPFERLRKPPGGIKHPSGDKEKHSKASGKLAEICGKKFIQSALWEKAVSSWEIGEVDAREAKKKDPELWDASYNSLSGDFKVIEILEHIRNALAHGNIFTSPNGKKQIKRIIFLNRIMSAKSLTDNYLKACLLKFFRRSRPKFTGKYKVLKVSPNDFNDFLINWIQFLSELKLDAVSNSHT
jgi:hypothetical protein